jgi:hypothetical protein
VTDTKIYKLDHGFSAWFWLCPTCLAEKKAKGWEVMETRDPPHKLECSECKWKRGQA